MQRKNLTADERKAATVSAVLMLAAEQNPSDITTSAIAQKMGLTQGALFRHFDSKDSIMEAVMSWVADSILNRIETAAQNESSPLAALGAVFTTHIQFVFENPGVPRLLLSELQRPGITKPKEQTKIMLTSYKTKLIQILETAIARKELPPELDIKIAVVMFIGSIQGLVMQALIAGDVSLIRRDAAGVFAIYLRGIGNNK